MNARRKLNSAISEFADDIKSFSSNISNNLTYLKKAADAPPCVGVREFEEVLGEMKEEVTELTQEFKRVEHIVVDSISCDELLGHALAMYQSNCEGVKRLEEHLKQFGFQPSTEELEYDPTFYVTSSVTVKDMTKDDSPVKDFEDANMDYAAIRPAPMSDFRKFSSTAVEDDVDALHLSSKDQDMASDLSAIKQTPRISFGSRASSTPDVFVISPSLLEFQKKYGVASSQKSDTPNLLVNNSPTENCFNTPAMPNTTGSKKPFLFSGLKHWTPNIHHPVSRLKDQSEKGTPEFWEPPLKLESKAQDAGINVAQDVSLSPSISLTASRLARFLGLEDISNRLGNKEACATALPSICDRTNSWPSPATKSQALSPSTQQLLSRVYGTSSHTQPSIQAGGTSLPAQRDPASASVVTSAAYEPQKDGIGVGATAFSSRLAILTSEYETLPSFSKSQLSLEQLNSAMCKLGSMLANRSTNGTEDDFMDSYVFTLDDMAQIGIGSKAKVFLNCLVKLKRAAPSVHNGSVAAYHFTIGN